MTVKNNSNINIFIIDEVGFMVGKSQVDELKIRIELKFIYR